MAAVPEVLRTVKVLRGLSDAALEQLVASNRVVTYRADEVVFRQNSTGSEMYIVLAGEAALMLDPAALGSIEEGTTELRKIHTFRPGDSFGELAVIDHRPRSGSIVAGVDDTQLLVLDPGMFEFVRSVESAPEIIIRNIVGDLASKLRAGNVQIVEQMLSGYYLSVLVEELNSETYECTPLIPLEKVVVIRNQESFLLSGKGRLLPQTPEKEAITIHFFSEPWVLRHLVGEGTPSGALLLNTLLSLIRLGRVPDRVDASPFVFEFKPASDRRAGKLVVTKTVDGSVRPYTIEWQVKGARYNETNVAQAYLNLYISTDEATSTRYQVAQVIDSIDMPVQKTIQQQLARMTINTSKYRLLIIHHRTHEVARTLRTITDLGYQIGAFIGIPYGDVDWNAVTMLDAASGANFMALKVLNHPTQPTRYEFDFRQSSFLDTQTERRLLGLYESPALSGDYLTAMQALAELRLEQALVQCRERGEKLIIYEDGAYIVDRIYQIYKDTSHRLHPLIKEAVDAGGIVGVIEVTVAGERKNVALIEKNHGKSLLTVLSNARSDIKSIFEAKGVGEAVIQGGATALGRLGLPTFQTRRVAVIGGNGAIGVRVVEQFTLAHNSTGNVYAVDVGERPFTLGIDEEKLPWAATRLKHVSLPRYCIADDCFPVTLNQPFNQRHHHLNPNAVEQAVEAFLLDGQPYRELAIANSYPLEANALKALWTRVGERTGYHAVDLVRLPEDQGVRYLVEKDGTQKAITLLPVSTVLAFKGVGRLIRNGIDTIVGVTGLPVFTAKDLGEFLARRNAPGQSQDELVLVSGSSKDYEFRKGIDLLNVLLAVCTGRRLATDGQLRWFADLYRDEMSFLQGEHFAALQGLLGKGPSAEGIEAVRTTAPALARAIGLRDDNQATWKDLLAAFVGRIIRDNVSIRKELRPDIGSIYHLVVNGQGKRVVMLADGFVVNFFARHEKGVKTEYIDSIVTMQLLSLVKLSTSDSLIPPGLYKMETQLQKEDMDTLWLGINEKCRSLTLP